MSDYIPPTLPTRRNKKHNRKKIIPLPENCWVLQPEDLPEFSSKIELSRGLFAIVDEDDLEYLSQFNWSVKPDGGTAYAVANVQGTEYKMHRVVMKINNGEGLIDHINHSGLDNRKCNLRQATSSENQGNRRRRTKAKNRFIGVLPALSGGYSACLRINGKFTKKNFCNEVEAARYYDFLATKHRGNDAKTNLAEGRFTEEELSTFGGKIANPLEEVSVVEGVKYQPNMVCLTSLEFQKVVHEMAEKQSKIELLEAKLSENSEKSLDLPSLTPHPIPNVQ